VGVTRLERLTCRWPRGDTVRGCAPWTYPGGDAPRSETCEVGPGGAIPGRGPEGPLVGSRSDERASGRLPG
jgi:hypothetical protein